MTLLDALQKIVSDQLKAGQLTDMAVGTVTSVDPLEIVLDVHQAALRGDAIILTDEVREKTIDVSGAGFFQDVNGTLCAVWGQDSGGGSSGAIITRPLAVGDKVLLLAVQHGQTYIVLSRL